ncbi:hypothetical protein [uncultured Gammaproteobacteria bacterium]|nr:hypothetical protein [uncultured Gammaproteobacteria bacterium]
MLLKKVDNTRVYFSIHTSNIEMQKITFCARLKAQFKQTLLKKKAPFSQGFFLCLIYSMSKSVFSSD